jgi:hypothetical protein
MIAAINEPAIAEAARLVALDKPRPPQLAAFFITSAVGR